MTISMISRILGIPKSTVHRYLNALEKRGLIVRGSEGYPDTALTLVRRLYELVRESHSLEKALDALVSGEVPKHAGAVEELRKEIERLRSFLEGFASSVLKRLDEIERRLDELEPPKGLPSPKKPWWKRIFRAQ